MNCSSAGFSLAAYPEFPLTAPERVTQRMRNSEKTYKRPCSLETLALRPNYARFFRRKAALVPSDAVPGTEKRFRRMGLRTI